MSCDSDLCRLRDCAEIDRALAGVGRARRPQAVRGRRVRLSRAVRSRFRGVSCRSDGSWQGPEFTNLWRTRQFEYSWLRSISGRYVDFSAITSDALRYTANAMHVELTATQRDQLLGAYSRLTPWPDTADTLRRLRAADVRVITIANFSPTMLRENAERAGLTPLFDALVSTDANHTYKPDPRAYRLGVDRLKLDKRDIVFAAFGGWDAAGAKSYRLSNRVGEPTESAAREWACIPGSDRHRSERTA